METKSTQPIIYEIMIEGHLDSHWSDWFEHLTITFPSASTTLLRGQLADQSALFGVLKKLHNMGLTLISVLRVGEQSYERYGDSR